MNTIFIYTLSDPRTGQVRYVGKTNNIKERFWSHCSSAQDKTHRGYWLASLGRLGLKSIIELVDEVNESEWAFWEQWWIFLFRSWGYKLCNLNNGGIGPDSVTEETKKKIAESNRGKKKPSYHVPYAQYSISGQLINVFGSQQEAGASLSMRYPTKLSRAAVRDLVVCGYRWRKVLAGKALDQLPDRVIKNNHLGHRHSLETKKKIGSYHKGKIVTQETRKKMSVALSARHRTISFLDSNP